MTTAHLTAHLTYIVLTRNKLIIIIVVYSQFFEQLQAVTLSYQRQSV